MNYTMFVCSLSDEFYTAMFDVSYDSHLMNVECTFGYGYV